jgi:DNA-binding transcriptional MocR family regulator
MDSDLRVYGVLCTRRNRKTKRCNPSHESIARDAGYSVSTVKAALRRLRALGYVDWINSRGPTGGQGTNSYWLPHLEDDTGESVLTPEPSSP